MKKNLLFILLFFSTGSFLYSQSLPDLLRYVNPFVGTARMGHTYPGATVPFGAVQLSPDTDTIPYEMNGKYNPGVYEYCAGYQYEDNTIVGFSHTHFSGTGHSDLGDILIMPTTGPLQMNPGTEQNPEQGYRSAFSHEREAAQPNYYQVWLEDHNILAELTTSERVGMHRYSFPDSDSAHIILDLVHGIYNYENKNVWTFVRVENDSLITGYRQTNGWARTRVVYFAIAFSKPFNSYGLKNYTKQEVYRGFWRKFDQNNNFPEMAGAQIKGHFDFNTHAGEQIQIKVALSSVSMEGALNNLNKEIPHWNFNEVRAKGQLSWNTELSKIQIESLRETDKTNFYTSMYHAFIGSTIYMDVDRKYRGLDQNIHTAENFTNYTTFSLWDTYRAWHPLLNVIQPSRNRDMIGSMLAHYDQSVHDLLPVWSHYANDNWCMIAYHSVSVIADAIAKGNDDFDKQHALQACVKSARNRYYDGLNYYIDMGYVPEDKTGSSVSKTLEYAYDDWCIAQMAQRLGSSTICDEFNKRSGNYKNVYDTNINYMRPRLTDGSFKSPFDVLSTHGQGFIEGNSWNYSLYVPHQPDSLVKMMGGKKRFAQHLDSLFTMTLPDKYFADTEDISRDGIIGNYVHGNEPSHHVPYLFNWTSEPWKTQSNVRIILEKMYKPTAGGLGGNDDCGQMSAWYIFSSLGFYPVAPGSDEYAIGSPLVKSAKLFLENGNTFEIEAIDQSENNIYVQRITLNGKELKTYSLKHSDITRGGKLIFHMSQKPKRT